MNRFFGMAVLSPVVILLGCGGGGGDAGSDPGAPAPGTSTTLRLRGDFSIQNDYSLTGKPSASGASSLATNRFSAQGTVEQLVTVTTDASGGLTFQPVGSEPMKVTATTTEVGHCESQNPEDATVVASVGDSSFTGPVSSPVDYTVRASALGPGDEFSLRLAAATQGTASLSFTAPNGSVQTLAQTCPGLPALLVRTPELGANTAALATTQAWSVFPTLGPRPSAAADQQLYDAIAQNPGGFHLGLATSAARDRWSYTGTRVLANSDTATETTRWTETIVLNWRLEKP